MPSGETAMTTGRPRYPFGDGEHAVIGAATAMSSSMPVSLACLARVFVS
jgi:hypothetical protein